MSTTLVETAGERNHATSSSGRQHALSPVVIRFGALGDMILLSSFLHFVRCRYGRPCFVIGTGPWNEPVYRGNTDVERVYSLSRHRPFPLDPAWWQVLPVLHRSAPGPIYVCEDTKAIRVQRLLRLSGVDMARCAFISDEQSAADDHYLDVLQRFGGRTPDTVPGCEDPDTYPTPAAMHVPRLVVFDAERMARDAWIEAEGWTGRPIVLVQTGNRRTMSKRRERHRRLNRDHKAWPVNRWVELLHRVHAEMPDAAIVLCGARQEIALLRGIEAAIALEAVATRELTLRQLFALCESAHSMISIDTGPAHVAAAVGLPVVVMYGSNSPRRWLPSSVGSSVVPVGGPPLQRVDQIPVQAVFDSWRSLVPGKRSQTCEHLNPASPCLRHCPAPVSAIGRK
jgi:ADP-heptose:LPS heptosyltransferase